MEIYGLWVVGLFLFALHGLLVLAHRNEVASHRRAAERVSLIVRKHLRRRGLR